MAANPYGPVTTTDSTHLTDDDWELSLPPIKYKRYPGTDKIKSVCYNLRQHQKCFTVVAILVVCILILFAMVIVLAIGHSPKGFVVDIPSKWQSTDQGLEFYPVPEDKTILIKFTPDDFNRPASQPIKQSLDVVLGNYITAKQLNETVFTDCNSTHNPADKTCRVSRTMFGDACSSHRNYGYLGGQPCVFVQLNLPKDVTIKPITKDSPFWNFAEEVMKNVVDPSYVPFTCNGTTSDDRETLMSVDGFGPKGERIMYYPEQGFPAFIYRKKNTNLPFLKPGVMVQFTSLLSRQVIHISCTAWGQLYDAENQLMDHQLLSTHFALYINHE